MTTTGPHQEGEADRLESTYEGLAQAYAEAGIPVGASIHDYYRALQKLLRALRRGEALSDTERALLGRLTGPCEPVLVNPDPFTCGSPRRRGAESWVSVSARVVRDAPWVSGVQYSDPFPDAIENDVHALCVEQPSGLGEVRYHVHLGEEYIRMVAGELHLEWLSPTAEAPESTTAELKMDVEGRRGAWFSSIVPHRGHAVGGAAKYIAFFSHPQESRPSGPPHEPDTRHVGERSTRTLSPDASKEQFVGLSELYAHLRRQRRIGTQELASVLKTNPNTMRSAVNRLEQGSRPLRSFEEVIKQSLAIGQSPLAVLPPTLGQQIRGCYLHHRDAILPKLRYQEDTTLLFERDISRVLLPYRWHEAEGLYVIPGSPPEAQNLVATQLYISDQETGFAGLDRIAGFNYRRLRAAHAGATGYSCHTNAVFFVVERGKIEVEWSTVANAHLHPGAFVRDPSDPDRWVLRREIRRSAVLREGSVMFIRPGGYPYRFVPAESMDCKLVCIERHSQAASASFGIDMFAPLRIHQFAQNQWIALVDDDAHWGAAGVAKG
ncbi:MAG: hypothetical protein IT431_13935 [Phycisphaerales bacterium]|nr:hypothetical protein [Phycisphaerales bacterium]